MGSVNLRFRQVHLDFHTSAACKDVGAGFDPEVFSETVKMGHVNSISSVKETMYVSICHRWGRILWSYWSILEGGHQMHRGISA